MTEVVGIAVGIVTPEILANIKARIKPSDFRTLKRTLKRVAKLTCKEYRNTHKRCVIAADFKGIWQTVIRCLEEGNPLALEYLAYGDERVNEMDRIRFFQQLCSNLNENAEFFLRNKLSVIEQKQDEHDTKNDAQHQDMLKRLAKIDQTITEKQSFQANAAETSLQWLTMPYNAASPNYVDRPEFHELMVAVKQHRKVLLHGMGGIGKTELMRKACEALKDDYQQIAWVQYTGSLASSLTSQIAVEEFKILPEAEKLEAIRQMLIREGEGLLLFVDNVSSNVQEDNGLEYLQRLEGTVIVTSRPPRLLTGFYDVPVGILEVEECKKLFYAYAGIKLLADEADLCEIIRMAGRHTLVMEILARSAGVRKMSISELLQRLREKGFEIHIPVATAHSEEVPEILPEQLEKLYDIADIQSNPLCVRILKNFSILPYLPVSDKDAVAFLELDEAQEQALYDLRDLGWLEQSDTGFAMHPVVKQVMQKEKVTLDDCKGFIGKLLDAANDFFSEVKYRPFIVQAAECFRDVDELVSRLYNALSWIHQDMGNLPEALKWQMKDIEIVEALYPEGKHPSLATSYNNLSSIHQDMGNLPEALAWQMKAMKIKEALYPDVKQRSLATSYNNLSMIQKDMGNLPEALKWQMRATEIFEVMCPDGNHVDLAACYNNLSTIYLAMGNLAEALKWQMRAKEIREALFPDGKHPDLAGSYNNLSMIHKDMGNLPEALKWQIRATEIKEALYSEGKHPSLATSYNNLSMIHMDIGNLLEALKWQMKAKEIREALFQDGKHPDLATSYNNLSSIYKAMGNLPEALKWQMRATEIREALYKDGKHSDLAVSYNNLSMIHLDMGNLPETLAWQKKAIEILCILFPDGIQPSLAISYGNLSFIYKAMGDLEEAAHWEKEANRIEEEIRKRDSQ